MSAATQNMRIGEVHALLRQEFPTIELSKIRYYEDKGLVQPSRSRKGYRLYTSNDVACLREAFRLAQQEFVPLRVIRQRLIEQGLLNDEPLVPSTKRAANEAASNVVSLPVSRPSVAVVPPTPVLREVGDAVNESIESTSLDSTLQFSRDEFLKASHVSEQQLIDLEFFGFLAPRTMAGRPVYDACDLLIAKRYLALGERGVDVRHLNGLKRTVERQVDLLNDLTGPLRLQGAVEPGRDVVAETRKVAEDMGALRSALLARALGDYFGH